MNALRVSCFTVACLAVPCVLLRYVCAPVTKSITCDWFLSSHVTHALEAQPLPKTIFSVHRYIDEVLDEIPALERVHARMHRYKAMHIKAQGHRPWRMINGQYVLTHDGIILPTYFFKKECLDTLLTIKADPAALELNARNSELHTFIKQLPDELRQATLMWHNKTFITLELPDFSPLILVAHHTTQFTEKLLTRLHAIQESVRQDKKIKKSLYADVRFSNQIILSRLKEGAS